MNNLDKWFSVVSQHDKYFKQVAVGCFELRFEGFRRYAFHEAWKRLLESKATVLHETFDRGTGQTIILVKQPKQ